MNDPTRLSDCGLSGTALRICQERGIVPAANLDEPPLYRSDFYTQQLADVIHRRWKGLYDTTEADHPRVVAWVRRHLENPAARSTLLLAGTTGVGKTWQAIGALKAIVGHHAQQGHRYDWQAVTHPDLNEELRPKSDDSHEYALDRYLRAELLILDDLGAGQVTSWTTDNLQRLVDYRWSHRAATIYTTNLTPDELPDAVGARVNSRLGDATHVVLTGDDRRWAR